MGWIGICGRMEFDCSSQFDKFAGSTLTHEKGFFVEGKVTSKFWKSYQFII